MQEAESVVFVISISMGLMQSTLMSKDWCYNREKMNVSFLSMTNEAILVTF